MWIVFLPKAVWKILFLSGARFGKIFGSELLFFCLCVQLVFFDVVLPMFLLYSLALFSQKLPEEIFSFSGARFAENFRERTLVFGLCVWSVFSLAFFAYVYSLSFRIVLLKAARKNFLLVRSAFRRQARPPFHLPPFFFSSSLVFFSWGRPGFSFFPSSCVCAGCCAVTVGTAQHALSSCLFSFFLSLPGLASLSLCGFSLCFLFSFTLSLSLSLSLACVELQRIHSWFASGKCIATARVRVLPLTCHPL